MHPQVPRRSIVSPSRVSFRLYDRHAVVTSHRSQGRPTARSIARLSRHRQHQVRRARSLRQVTLSSAWHRPMLARLAQHRLRSSARRVTRLRPQLLSLKQPPAMWRSPRFSDKQRRRAAYPLPTARSIARRQRIQRQRTTQYQPQRSTRLRFSAAQHRRADRLQAMSMLRRLQLAMLQRLLQIAWRLKLQAQPVLQLSLARPVMQHQQHQQCSGPQMFQASQALPSTPIQHQTQRIQAQQMQRHQRKVSSQQRPRQLSARLWFSVSRCSQRAPRQSTRYCRWQAV